MPKPTRFSTRHEPIFNGYSSFVGREEELNKLAELVRSQTSRIGPIIVYGAGGIGKTALVRDFLRRFEFDSEWIDVNEMLAYRRENPEERPYRFIERLLPNRGRRGRFIAILDGVDTLDDKLTHEFIYRMLEFKSVRNVIVTTRATVKVRGARYLNLTGLSLEDTAALLTRTIGKEISSEDVTRLAEEIRGSPAAVDLVAEFLEEHDVNEVWGFLEGKLYDLRDQIKAPTKQLVKIVQPKIIVVTDYLIKNLQKYPQDIYGVTSRQFEEIIADLLKDKGFDIELTPQSRDGGKDILAYLDTDAGKLLTLVEAKRYAKTKPVGVSIIRSLYGTLCDYDANSAMLVTTSRFSKDTKEFQKKHPYRLALREYSDVVEWINKYKGK